LAIAVGKKTWERWKVGGAVIGASPPTEGGGGGGGLRVRVSGVLHVRLT
jgi:hypothetical protein